MCILYCRAFKYEILPRPKEVVHFIFTIGSHPCAVMLAIARSLELEAALNHYRNVMLCYTNSIITLIFLPLSTTVGIQEKATLLFTSL